MVLVVTTCRYEAPDYYYIPEALFRSSQITRKFAQACVRPHSDYCHPFYPKEDGSIVDLQFEEWKPYKNNMKPSSTTPILITGTYILDDAETSWHFTYSDEVPFTADDDYEYFWEKLPEEDMFPRNGATRELFDIARKHVLADKDPKTDSDHINSSDIEEVINAMLVATNRPVCLLSENWGDEEDSFVGFGQDEDEDEDEDEDPTVRNMAIAAAQRLQDLMVKDCGTERVAKLAGSIKSALGKDKL